MDDTTTRECGGASAAPERYTMGYDAAWTRFLQKRTAAREAGFFLPHLRAGMNLLDCGCGPGTISAGLSQAIAPGKVVGLDIGLNHLRLARSHAAERNITGICFTVGDAYALPFAASSFDAVFLHNVLSHLKNPLEALREIHRFLPPEGVIGISHPDYSGLLIAPSDPRLDQGHELVWRLVEHNGGNPAIGKHQRNLLHQAGFVRSEVSAYYTVENTREEVRARAELGAHRIAASQIAAQIVELGWASRSELEEISAAWKAWGEHPGAFMASAAVTAVGWKQ